MTISLLRSLFIKSASANCYTPRICWYLPARFRSTKSEKVIKEKQVLNKEADIKFRHAEHGQFYQERPKLNNTFLSDAPLQSFLNHYVPKEVNVEISQDLKQFGDRIINEIDDLGWECELYPPTLETQDVWGRRIDDLKTCTAWKKLHDISAEEGLVAIPYERKLDYWSRLHQICKSYMFNPSSGLYSCPLAMTDGAAKTIMSSDKSVVGEKKEFFEKTFNNLISRDPQKFWTSGQWMTEKRGGSDVAGSESVLKAVKKSVWKLEKSVWKFGSCERSVWKWEKKWEESVWKVFCFVQFLLFPMPKRKRGVTGDAAGRQQAIRKSERRAVETEEERNRRLSAMTHRGHDRRAEETEEQRNSRLSVMAQRGQERRAEEIEEQRNRQLSSMLQHARERRLNVTEG
ncbi:Acyl-CoA dehydrogenase family member 11 [Araneus ventricosus]|uniref:Acyl-CoA dehydrogenase family member 11 n=1 Tax=Araneus ventricosus TaxID=182803 RepID=A0A4Y2ARP2_ARAVE|nr:Acyl-CoA dehydrogenase family member 11 [Araneus ventricosus]